MSDLPDVIRAITAYSYRYTSEAELQQALFDAMASAGLTVRREVRLTPTDRIDFVVGRIGIEVKVAGSAAEVKRQLARYRECPDLDVLLLVTTRAAHQRIRLDYQTPGQPGPDVLVTLRIGGAA